METKVCTKCGRELPLTDLYFKKRTDSKDGFRNQCIECRTLYIIDKKENPEKYIKEVNATTKICVSCEKGLPFDAFNKKKHGKYGLGTVCKECKRKHYYENHEEIRAQRKESYDPNKNFEQCRKYRLEHKEELRIKRQAYCNAPGYKEAKKLLNENYRLNNKEKLSELKRIYHQNNRVKGTMANQRRKALKKQLPATLTIPQWNEIKAHFNNRCYYCNKEMPLHQEHFVPVTKGGGYTYNNILPSCRSCNSSKHDRLFHEWYKSYRHYSKKREKAITDFLGYNNGVQQLRIG